MWYSFVWFCVVFRPRLCFHSTWTELHHTELTNSGNENLVKSKFFTVTNMSFLILSFKKMFQLSVFQQKWTGFGNDLFPAILLQSRITTLAARIMKLSSLEIWQKIIKIVQFKFNNNFTDFLFVFMSCFWSAFPVYLKYLNYAQYSCHFWFHASRFNVIFAEVTQCRSVKISKE